MLTQFTAVAVGQRVVALSEGDQWLAGSRAVTRAQRQTEPSWWMH
jgi:hypothetical protein